MDNRIYFQILYLVCTYSIGDPDSSSRSGIENSDQSISLKSTTIIVVKTNRPYSVLIQYMKAK